MNCELLAHALPGEGNWGFSGLAHVIFEFMFLCCLIGKCQAKEAQPSTIVFQALAQKGRPKTTGKVQNFSSAFSVSLSDT